MVQTCSVPGCKSRQTRESSASFHRFPADAKRRAAWLNAVGRGSWEPKICDRICSLHFVGGKYLSVIENTQEFINTSRFSTSCFVACDCHVDFLGLVEACANKKAALTNRIIGGFYGPSTTCMTTSIINYRCSPPQCIATLIVL